MPFHLRHLCRSAVRWTRPCTASLAGLLSLISVQAGAADPGAATLRLADAVAIATTDRDPTVLQLERQGEAGAARAVAEGQWEDPELRVGFANWPVDSFAFDQEPMTQIQGGLRQRLPRGRTLALRQRRGELGAEAEQARARARQLGIARAARLVWLELYLALAAEQTARRSQAEVRALQDELNSAFAAGLASSQDLLRAELELALIDDRLIESDREVRRLRVELERLIGPAHALRPLPAPLPALPVPDSLNDLLTTLSTHPELDASRLQSEARSQDVALAEEAYKPSLSVDLGYGVRGGGRADFASLMLSLDVPLFTERRQSRRLEAARLEHEAAMFARDATLLELRRRAQSAWNEYRRLGERRRLYRTSVLPRARDNAEAATDAYASKMIDFAELIRSRLQTLDSEFAATTVAVRQTSAAAELLYLMGDAR